MPIWSLGRHLDVDRSFHSWYPQYFYTQSLVDGDVFPVGRTKVIDVSQDFYIKCGLNFPMLNRIEPLAMGRTSVTTRHRVYDASSGAEVVSYKRQLVYVSRRTRQAVPVPDEVAKHFRAVAMTSSGRVVCEERPAATSSYVYDVTAQHSDCDWSFHVNSFTYARWCVDAASTATATGKLSGVSGDISEYCVERLEMLHTGECFPGERLRVHVWEDATVKPLTLRFQIEKETGEKVLFCKMSFHKDVPKFGTT